MLEKDESIVAAWNFDGVTYVMSEMGKMFFRYPGGNWIIGPSIPREGADD